MPSLSFGPKMKRMGSGVSTSGIAGSGEVTTGGMFDRVPDDPMIGRRTPGQQLAYKLALEAERDERRAEGDEAGARLCEAELRSEAERNDAR
jgi:hypothetical protein